MAVPVYATDLTLITDAQSGTWGEFVNMAAGDTPTLETDYYIQGTGCYSSDTNGKTGLASGAVLTADLAGSFTPNYTCAFIWHVLLPGNGMDTYANAGLRAAIGSGLTNWSAWNVGGRDKGRNPYGGWQNYAVNPSKTPDFTNGTGLGATYTYFGAATLLTSAISKGTMHGWDAMYYGRGITQFLYGSTADGYAMFDGMAAVNDNQNNRWGLFQEEGTGYLWKGMMRFGTDVSIVDFRDRNINITIDDAPATYNTFNRIEIRNTNTYVEWNNVNFTALIPGQLAPGQLEVVADASVKLDACSFADMGTFIFKPRSILTSCVFRRCASINQGGATFEECTFNDASGGVTLYVSNMNLIQNCNFRSNGSNHAMYLGPDSSGVSYTIAGHSYENYATTNGTTGNEVIYNNSGGSVTINYSAGNTPTYRNGTNSTTTLVSSVNLTLAGMIENSEVTIVRISDGVVLYNLENVPISGQATYAYDAGLSGTDVDILVFNTQYEAYALEYTLTNVNATIPISQVFDRVYLNL